MGLVGHVPSSPKLVLILPFFAPLAEVLVEVPIKFCDSICTILADSTNILGPFCCVWSEVPLAKLLQRGSAHVLGAQRRSYVRARSADAWVWGTENTQLSLTQTGLTDRTRHE